MTHPPLVRRAMKEIAEIYMYVNYYVNLSTAWFLTIRMGAFIGALASTEVGQLQIEDYQHSRNALPLGQGKVEEEEQARQRPRERAWKERQWKGGSYAGSTS